MTTWTTLLSVLESRAAEHDRYSSELILQVADPLKNLATRYEELRKSHADYAGKLERERDSSYGDLKKTKGRYDGACQEVENRRKKTESSFDHGKGKAQSAYQQQLMEMHNVKVSGAYIETGSLWLTTSLEYIFNHYQRHEQAEGALLSRVRSRSIRCEKSIALLLRCAIILMAIQSLQDLSETRVHQVNALWSHAVQLETSTLSRSTDHLKYLGSEIPRNDPRLDSMMFVRHNVAQWQEPLDLTFEPSPVWLDDSAMATDETAKIYLRNVLSRSKGQLRELKQEVDKRRKEVENIKRIRQSVREGRDKRDEVELVRFMFAQQESLHEVERQRLTAEVETQTITSTVGDVSVGAQNHQFKSQTFKVPTNCDLCGERIWGLSAKGFDCRDCGYTCHSKCELKVPAECPGEQSKEEKKKLKVERQAVSKAAPPQTNGAPHDGATELPALSRSNTMDTLSSGYAASANRSVSGRLPLEEASTDGTSITQPPASKPTIRKSRVVAPPPTQYVSELPTHAPSGSRSSTSHPAEVRGKMNYAYNAQADGEVSVEEGEEVVIVEPDGKHDPCQPSDRPPSHQAKNIPDAGWTSVRLDSHSTGLVPTSYIEILPTPTPSERPISSYSSSSASLAGSIPGKKKGPAVAPKRGAKKLKYVEALYDYEARSEMEWSMSEGEKFVLITKGTGDGWADVEKGGVTRSVPANYIREV